MPGNPAKEPAAVSQHIIPVLLMGENPVDRPQAAGIDIYALDPMVLLSYGPVNCTRR